MVELEPFIGEKAKLVSFSSSLLQFNVELIACFRHNKLLVSLPPSLDRHSILRIGQRFQLRFKQQNIIYCYHMKIFKICNKAYIGLQFVLANSVDQTVSKQDSRIKIEEKEFKVLLLDGKQKISVSVADISINGARLVAQTRLGRINDVFNIELISQGRANSIRLPCKIQYVRSETGIKHDVGKNIFHHGVEFIKLATNVENLLYRFVR